MGISTTSILENNEQSYEMALTKAHGYDSLGQPIEAGQHLLLTDSSGGMANFVKRAPLIHRPKNADDIRYGVTVSKDCSEKDYAELFEMLPPLYIGINENDCLLKIDESSSVHVSVTRSMEEKDGYQLEITEKDGNTQKVRIVGDTSTPVNLDGKTYHAVRSQKHKRQIAFVRFQLNTDTSDISPIEIQEPEERLSSMEQALSIISNEHPWITPMDILDLTELTDGQRAQHNKYIVAIAEDIRNLHSTPTKPDLIRLEKLYDLWSGDTSNLNQFEVAYLAISDYADLVDLMHTINGIDLEGTSPLARQELTFRTLARVEMETANRRKSVDDLEMELFGRYLAQELRPETIERFRKGAAGSNVLGICNNLDQSDDAAFRNVITVYVNRSIHAAKERTIKERVEFLAYLINHERLHVNKPFQERRQIKTLFQKSEQPEALPVNPYEELFIEYVSNQLPVRLSSSTKGQKSPILQKGSIYQHVVHKGQSGALVLRGGGAANLTHVINGLQLDLSLSKRDKPYSSHLKREISDEDIYASLLYTAYSRQLYGEGTFMGRKVIGFAELHDMIKLRTRTTLRQPLKSFEDEFEGCKDIDYRRYSASKNGLPQSHIELAKYKLSQLSKV